MAIASCSVKVISRGKGRSAVAAAAYRSGQAMRNEYDGLAHDYTRKSGIIYKDILTPAGAPDWAHDRQQLWNRVEQTERRKDAQLAREVMIALPRELSSGQHIELATAYAQTFVHQGMIADVAVHDGRDGNPHAHIMLTMRPLEGDGFSKKKNRDWNTNEKLVEWRKEYESITNQYLSLCGHEQRIDVRSYVEQGIDQIPTVHLGHYAHHLEQRGIQTDRGDINRQIQEANCRIEEISREISQLEQEREHLISKGDDIVHYRMVREEVRSTAEALERRLTERGEHNLVQQQKNAEAALQRLQHRQPEPEEPSHQNRPSSAGRQRPFGFDEPPQPKPRSQEEPAPPNRPPPLRRQREDRHLAGERLRHRTQGPEDACPSCPNGGSGATTESRV